MSTVSETQCDSNTAYHAFREIEIEAECCIQAFYWLDSIAGLAEVYEHKELWREAYRKYAELFLDLLPGVRRATGLAVSTEPYRLYARVLINEAADSIEAGGQEPDRATYSTGSDFFIR